MTPAQEAEAQQRALEMFKCLRAHGVDIPDSAASGGRVRFGPGTGVDPASPTFQRAQKACASKGGPAFSVQSKGAR
jgi:hypothetical protein